MDFEKLIVENDRKRCKEHKLLPLHKHFFVVTIISHYVACEDYHNTNTEMVWLISLCLVMVYHNLQKIYSYVTKFLPAFNCIRFTQKITLQP